VDRCIATVLKKLVANDCIWGVSYVSDSVLYSLQHGALFVTSFMFLMGLLFKVEGVSSSSGTYTAR
jgi:hypothetical protein